MITHTHTHIRYINTHVHIHTQNLKTGAKLWQLYTAPENGGKPGSWSGNAVW